MLKAKTTSEYNKYKKQYEAWQKKNKGSFGWKYNKKIDSVKDLIEKAIDPESAIDELKNIVNSAETAGGFENDSQIKDWMNKYPLTEFHEVHKKEVQSLTDKAFSLIKIPENENLNTSDLDSVIPGLIFMSPTQKYAVYDLKKIIYSDSQNFNSLLNWVYTYRNVSFSEAYRQAISTLIPSQYGLKLDSTYSIPVLTNKNLTANGTKKIVKDTVINYFGILLCGNSFDSTRKSQLSEIYTQSKETDSLSKIADNKPEKIDKLENEKGNNRLEIKYSEEENKSEIKLEEPLVIDEINNSVTEPVDEKDITISEPVSEDDITISEPVSEDDITISEPVSENDITISEPVSENIISVDEQNEAFGSIPSEDNETFDYSNPYQLTSFDIQNIEATYTLIEPKEEEISQVESPIVNDELTEDLPENSFTKTKNNE